MMPGVVTVMMHIMVIARIMSIVVIRYMVRRPTENVTAEKMGLGIAVHNNKSGVAGVSAG